MPTRPTTTCATFEVTTTVRAKADEGDAALHGRVVEDVLEVEREHEELREGDRADDRHRDVRGGEGARGGRSAAAAAVTRERRLDRDEGRDERR